jgi:hypothetical protein
MGSWKRGGMIPKLFRGLILRVFDLDGTLKPTPDPHAIFLIRQLLGAVRKLRVDCGLKARIAAVREFSKVDQEVRLGSSLWDGLDEVDAEQLGQLSLTEDCPTLAASAQGSLPGFEASYLPYGHAKSIQQVADFISACLGPFSPSDARFKHGPGAVSDRKFSASKYAFDNWPDRLDKVFPMADFAVANYGLWLDSSLYKSSDWKTRKEFPAKLMAVPKTIKTPRLIAAEPTSLQWCQQSIRDFLYTRVRRSCIGAFVDFCRQDANGSLALEASHTKGHGTIDLSSASDRISCWLVERLFRRNPSLIDALRATRSLYVEQEICRDLPRHLRLRKFSTMGNAVTFPVQSLVFLSVCLGSLFYVRGLTVSARALEALGCDTVRVFGDDLIVPEDCAGATIDALHALGLRVNPDKTFLEGNFRESCGVDAYDGKNVTTISILDAPMKAKPGTVVSSVDVHNNLCSGGMYRTAAFIQKTVERLGQYNTIRDVAHGSGSFGWFPNYLNRRPKLSHRVDKDRMVRQVRCLTVCVRQRKHPPKEGSSLLQYFTEGVKVVDLLKSKLVSESHLGNPRERAKSSLKLRWVDVA